jgi:hypothetical protein
MKVATVFVATSKVQGMLQGEIARLEGADPGRAEGAP